MKKKQILPTVRRKHHDRKFPIPAPGISILIIMLLCLLHAPRGFSQKAQLSKNYLIKVQENNGSFMEANSQVYDDSLHIGIGTITPGEKLDVVGGNVRTDGSYISLAAQGISPLNVQSSTLVVNLNSDLLDGLHAIDFAPLQHNHSIAINGYGIQPFSYNGGSGAVIAVDFAGSGTATQAARSDHSHSGALFGAGSATQVAFFSGPNTVTGTQSLYWNNTNKRLGIGTVTPQADLHISANSSAAGIRLSEVHGTGTSPVIATSWDLQNSSGALSFNYLVNGSPVNVFRIVSNGASGTLTMNGMVSAKRLQLTLGAVNNYILTTNATGLSSWKDPAIMTGWTVSGNNVYKINGAAAVGTTDMSAMLNIRSTQRPAVIVESATGSAPGYAILTKLSSAQSKAFAVESNGIENLVIWGDGYLQVDNKIKAREVEVVVNVWQDAVFDKDYPLRDLNEVESFISQNHHLPGIPSEAEVLKNGIALGEMNSLLLQKVEELTLYVIELNKTNERMQEKIDQLTSPPKP